MTQRLSVVISALNEGALLRKTLEHAREDLAGIRHELIVVDDGSTDGSTTGAAGDALDCDLLLTLPERRGVSASRFVGATHAVGDVLLFLDGHCRPASGAFADLADTVREHDGSLVAPLILGLDAERFEAIPGSGSCGLRYDLMTLECRYLPPGAPEIKAHTDQYRVRLEVPSVSGCCFAIGREVYDRLGGLAEEMLCYGVEDFDLALSAWLANAGPATFPDLVVYHRYQSQYLSYSIDMREVKANHLRCAYSHIGRSDRPATVKLWGAWCNAARERWGESLFEDAWSRFKATISVTDARRSRVEQLARRTGRTLEDYATRFDLGWPA